MNTSTKTLNLNPNQEQIEMIIYTAKAYAVLAQSLRSMYYLQLTKKTLLLLEKYNNVYTVVDKAA